MQAVAPLSSDTAPLGLRIAYIGAAAAIAWACVVVGHERTCTLRESPGAEWCAPPAAGSSAELERLRARIARNPGDANAYAALALADRSVQHQALVDTALRLAPREPNLLLHRAAAAFDRHDWRAAVAPLVELAGHRDVPVAAASLAYLVGIGQGALLQPHLTPGSLWLQRMLVQMRAAGAPLSSAMPLVVRALEIGALDPDTVHGYVRDLKAGAAWSDAYALWLSLHGQALPVLFNASFDHAFEADGFDWEVPDAGPPRRAGAVVERRRAEQRGGVLDLQFTGRAIALPIVRQYLFIAPGRYRLRGSYLARQLRADEGLRWAVRCTSTGAGASAPLRDTRGLWQAFDFEFEVPVACGVVASLQLETAGDAALGAHGRMSFDALELERVGP